MAEATHAMVPHHLPPFIVPPGEADILFIFIVCILLAIILMVGNFYFKLHALPEKMAHSANSTQLQLVGVLALLALFTHNNIFWVAALLLAALRIPDFSTPLASIAQSLNSLSERIEGTGSIGAQSVPGAAPAEPAIEAAAAPEPAAAPMTEEVERKGSGNA